MLNRFVTFSLTVLFSLMMFTADAVGIHLFTSDHDLSSTLINDVFVDSEGFVWISTESGLNRYDGSKVTTYKRKQNDKTSLLHDYVNSVFEDSKGNLFVSTHGGVQLYDKLNDKFALSSINADGTPYSGAVSKVFELPDGKLITMGNAINEMTITSEGLKMTHKPYGEKTANADDGAVDREGNLWLALDHGGVAKVTRNGKVIEYLSDLNGQEFTAIAIAPDGLVYAGTDRGELYVLNPTADRFVLIESDIDGSIITDIYPVTADKVYVATDGAGLYAYNKSTQQVSRVELPLWHDSTLKIHSVREDSYSNLWFGIYQKGLLKVPPKDTGFNTIDQRSGKNVYIGSSCVSSLLTDADGNLWIGTDNDGLYWVSADKKNARHYPDNLPKVIMGIFNDSRGNLWVGSYDAGCGILNPATGTMMRVHLVDANGQTVNKVYSFAETPDGSVWIATMGGGVFRYNPLTRTAEHVKEISGSINPWISDIVFSPVDKNLYLGTYDGFYKLNPMTLESEPLTRGMIVTSIYEDTTNHTFWLGTPSGLAVSYNGNIVSKIFTTDDGLPSNSVYAVRKSGNSLWISTNCGLSQYNLDNNTFVNYDVNEGLQSNEFYKNSVCTDAVGNIYFGGINGLSYFKPQDITSGGRKLDVRITDFYIGGVSVRDQILSGGKPVITEPVYKAKVFYLAHDDNSFSVEFATKQYASSSITDYYYSFDNGEWEKLPKSSANSSLLESNILTFSNVKSGRHQLRIKAVENGVESDTVTVDIIVAHPWYATWWATVLYCVLVLLAVILLMSHLRRRTRRQKVDLVRKHEEDIKEAKLQFFTNISHEIRTPLTLVMSPLQRLMGEDGDTSRQKVYRTILRNSQRIHKLVDELLDLRKIDNKQMKLRFSEVNIVGFLCDLYETFLPAATSKNITLTYHHDGIDELKAWVDPSNFDKIVMNLLSNAVKFTPQDGKVDITLTTGEDSSIGGPLSRYFRIRVTDTGCGISEVNKEHIFDRFFQCDNNKVGGTGIGLHLSHSLVLLHHGEIEVSDNPEGQGTCFTVTLPIGNSHLAEGDMVEDSSDMAIDKQLIAMNSMVADQAVTPEPEKNNTPSSRRLVYIVDDDNEVRNFLVETMNEKFRVEAFANGVEALDAIHHAVPDLIVTDVMMPEMDGLTLVSKIRQNMNFNHIPVIMLTAKNREEDTLEGLDTGADAYLTKPFNVDILIRTARNLLENRRMLRNVFSGKQDLSDKVDDINVQSNDEKLLDRVMKVVNKNISNPNITVEMIAAEIGISRVHLHRKLKELTNQSTRDFIRNIRLQQAAKMLREKKFSVAEVSDLVGFKHPNNFSTKFKEMFGMSPSAYAEKYHGASGLE